WVYLRSIRHGAVKSWCKNAQDRRPRLPRPPVPAAHAMGSRHLIVYLHLVGTEATERLLRFLDALSFGLDHGEQTTLSHVLLKAAPFALGDTQVDQAARDAAGNRPTEGRRQWSGGY